MIRSDTNEKAECEYDDLGNIIYSKENTETTQNGSSAGVFVVTCQYEYDSSGNLEREEEETSIQRTVTEYERDSQRREIKETETCYDGSIGELKGTKCTETEYTGEYISKVTETQYGRDGDQIGQYVSLYDENGRISSRSGNLNSVQTEWVYERDEQGHAVLTTETTDSYTILLEEQYEENGRDFTHKDTYTGANGISNIRSWYSQVYDTDGHSFIRTEYELADVPVIGAKAGDVSSTGYYQYLPLSEALVQQGNMQ